MKTQPPKRTSPHIPSDLSTLPTSAVEARRIGSMYFFNGKPCLRGHLSARRAANSTCQQCSNERSYEVWLEKRPEREAAEAQREAVREAQRQDPMYQDKLRAKARASAQQQKQHRMQEEGTEEYYAAARMVSRAKYHADVDKQRRRAQERRDRGLVGTKMKRQRTPPYLTEEEGAAIKRVYRSRKVGEVVDHIVPIVPPADVLVVGIHAPQNLQHLSRRENLQKGNQFACSGDEASEYVRLGMAVWRYDVDPRTGEVDWSRYPRDEDW